MNLRYQFLALLNLLAGGFIVTATFAFSASTAVTLGFAVSIGVLVVSLAMVYRAHTKNEPVSLLALGAVTAAVASWTIVAANTFADDTARWMVFASGCAHVGLSVLAFLLTEGVTDKPAPRRRAAARRR